MASTLLNDSTSKTIDVSTHDEPSQSSTRMRKKRSSVWKDFDIVQNEHGEYKAVCKFCKQHLSATSSNGTSNLRSHISRCKARKAAVSEENDGITRKDEGTPTFRNSKFNQERSRNDLAKMIVKHDYSFSMVDHGYFREFVKNLQPSFQLKHRNTISSDIKSLYKEERSELYGVLGRLKSRISLTTDLWTSQNTSDCYLCLTGHFIDDDWILRKKILNFQLMESESHSGEEMTKVVMKCLVHWNIDKKVSTITLDNASANDVMVTRLKENLNREGVLISRGDFFHVRCAAHVLNLVVKDGINVLGDTLTKIRDSCKYVRLNAQRKIKWREAVGQVKDQILTKKNVSIDCPTRWNSTYEMLCTALDYKEAFARLAAREEDFKTNPSREDWAIARTICDCLKNFYESTNNLSGSQYPTADIYFPEICEIHIHLLELLRSKNVVVKGMALRMYEKFSKYWANASSILAVAYALNPGCKFKFVEKYYQAIFGKAPAYGEPPAQCHTTRVFDDLTSIYDSYAPSKPISSLSTQSSSSSNVPTSSKGKRIASWYEEEGMESTDNKTELEKYLGDPLDRLKDVSVLDWWNLNKQKYPTLAKMAKDILAIPATSVPSESAFSTGGRVLNAHRASLAPNMVQALICTQDWLPSLSNDFRPCSTNEYPEVNVGEGENHARMLVDVDSLVDTNDPNDLDPMQS